MQLAIIILNWNAAADTIRCVHHVAGWERIQATVWVVDNGSTDGSPEAILRACPTTRLIRNSANLGFAGGTNRGIAAALSTGDAPVLLLNNDATIEQDDVIRLLNSLAENPSIGFIGPLLFDSQKTGRLLAAGGRDPARHHQSHILRLTPGGPLQIVECVPGTVVIARSQVLHTIGLLDEDYFFSSEVADLCMRGSRHGYLSAIDTRARAFHNLDRSSALRAALHVYYIIRNRFLLIRKFHRRWSIFFYGFWACYSLALSLKAQLKGKPATARVIRLGLLDGLRGRFGGQNERVLSVSAGTAGRTAEP
jgi:hypothetical protein